MSGNAAYKRPELLAPAGDLEKLRFAFAYGADAAYAGAGEFSLRANSGFDLKEIEQGIGIAHGMGKRLFLALNAFLRDDDLKALPAYLEQLAPLAPDALIVSDPGVFRLCMRYAPGIPLHISTQANNMNSGTLRFWSDLGASRVVLSRELSLAQAAAAAEMADIECEIFVHGAICISYSGRCLISSYLTGRSANSGDCAQPCRWRYALCEEKRPGEYLPIEEDDRGAYFFNSRDLCLLPLLPELIRGGFSSWKIEGRNKSAYYVANVTRIYRAALDSFLSFPDEWHCMEEWLRELEKVSHRQYTYNFALSQPDCSSYRYAEGQPVHGYDFVAVARSVDDGLLELEQRNHFQVGDEIEILLPNGGLCVLPVSDMFDDAGQRILSACHPKQIVRVPCEFPSDAELPLICRRAVR
ncbi:MAG: U32 family peptidase C-terminal domain-containing protein [Firmicutes bacterium]|nr:U32 family peptidase C-terminal domain-containing protein [Bacillota bacterium]